ncbi:TlpA family protein disulfide reductase [Paenibacillus sacheonensis]|uniref:Redoxin family protein n=1 Tax=Paenibacillus sacheonensis TaxID=742054 RepID=A0A7X4YS13_9BACL|nr:redoxin family protein [Paenibacillus sacheonensis]MBM7566379.1 peptide methionine sulfoxide reductase msrA/msrB [Paenibacillus sacheonensis]NBC70581.1 redoxin family protein [Paenibacillus sacheonensis]
MNRTKWSLTVFALLSLLLLTACGSMNSNSAAANATKAAAVNKGSAAPNFDLKDLDGNEVTLASLAGQKVYVKYWASWCPICLAGMDELNTLAGQTNDFKVITIVSPNYNGEQSAADFTEWFRGLQAENTGKNIRVLLDEGGKWAKKFGIRGYPTSLYIGSDGVLVKTAPGQNANEAITDAFKQIS